MSILKCCPFCGGEAKKPYPGKFSRGIEGYLYYTISCTVCGARVDGKSGNPYLKTGDEIRQSAMDKWNSRFRFGEEAENE